MDIRKQVRVNNEMPAYFKPTAVNECRSPSKIIEATNINELMKMNYSPSKSSRLPYLKEASDMN